MVAPSSGGNGLPTQDRWLPPALAYAACHFVVDLACIGTMLGVVGKALGANGRAPVLLAILAYDLLAFCLQLPAGALLDQRGEGAGTALASCGIVAAGIVLALMPSVTTAWVAVLLVAVGNAGFHCAGGIEMLCGFPGRATPPGIFIATGAGGVFLGERLARGDAGMVAMLLLSLLAVCPLLILLARRTRGGRPTRSSGRPLLPAASPQFLGACLLLAVTVALRSYAGMTMALPWKETPVLSVAIVLGVMGGKAVGGAAADRWGLRMASVVSLAGSAALFPFSWQLPAAGIAAVFLFNFTMPVTLVSLADLMPGSRGLAFGVSSFSLATGALPALLSHQTANPSSLCVMALASLATLVAALRLAERIGTRDPGVGLAGRG